MQEGETVRRHRLVVFLGVEGFDQAGIGLVAQLAADLERQARTRSPSILDDGWRKCATGMTSSEEVLRVTRED